MGHFTLIQRPISRAEFKTKKSTIAIWIPFISLLGFQFEEMKGIQIGNEEVKLLLFADDIILYTENPKESIRKLLEIINYSKVAGYKINLQKFVAFLYSTKELAERELRNTVPFTIVTKE